MNSSFTKPKAILFDWDNTLVDTHPLITQSLEATLSAFGHDHRKATEFEPLLYQSASQRFQEVFKERWKEARAFFYETAKKIPLDQVLAMEGAEELLSHLSHYRIPTGIISNKRADLLKREVFHLGWTSHFNPIIGSGDTTADKPSPIPLLHALKVMQLEPSLDIWFVGDSVVDWECANQAKCRPILLSQQKPPDTFNSSNSPPLLYLSNCRSLKKILS